MEGDGRPPPGRPYPTVKGLWGKAHDDLNNVETWANIPAIIEPGADWYAAIGTENSKGTKVFSLVGKVNNTGLVEVPMGTTLREIIYDIGGGIRRQAVQGGPDRRALRRLHPQAVPRTCQWTTTASPKPWAP